MDPCWPLIKEYDAESHTFTIIWICSILISWMRLQQDYFLLTLYLIPWPVDFPFTCLAIFFWATDASLIFMPFSYSAPKLAPKEAVSAKQPSTEEFTIYVTVYIDHVLSRVLVSFFSLISEFLNCVPIKVEHNFFTYLHFCAYKVHEFCL